MLASLEKIQGEAVFHLAVTLQFPRYGTESCMVRAVSSSAVNVSCVADPYHFDMDPDPTFHFDADPDPTFHFNTDPDPPFTLIWI